MPKGNLFKSSIDITCFHNTSMNKFRQTKNSKFSKYQITSINFKLSKHYCKSLPKIFSVYLRKKLSRINIIYWILTLQKFFKREESAIYDYLESNNPTHKIIVLFIMYLCFIQEAIYPLCLPRSLLATSLYNNFIFFKMPLNGVVWALMSQSCA
mgnify:CR=1 FL=1